ncbi:hypothetical protein CRG98_039159 [Punica granatum]|uniref:Aminotransferase-like plant mobile domain-containing protein n=1 Tax=Punica granatum TaxID=22663 RepID=A0A2I0I8X1_PUNGR|nr:hypothetical protein CRG98_039159 [Punica granatum]
MDRSAPSLRLESFMPLGQEIIRIRRTFRTVDRAFIHLIIGDLVRLVECPVDWIFLRTAAEFWDPQHAVFNFQGIELTPTVKEYKALIQRPMPTARGILLRRSSTNFRTGGVTVSESRAPLAVAPEAESFAQVAMHAELQSIREERDQLCGELMDAHAEVADYRELQRELTQTRAQAANLDREIAHLSATLDRTRAKARKVSHP